MILWYPHSRELPCSPCYISSWWREECFKWLVWVFERVALWLNFWTGVKTLAYPKQDIILRSGNSTLRLGGDRVPGQALALGEDVSDARKKEQKMPDMRDGHFQDSSKIFYHFLGPPILRRMIGFHRVWANKMLKTERANVFCPVHACSFPWDMLLVHVCFWLPAPFPGSLPILALGLGQCKA